MTELYLQKTGSTWHRVHFDASQNGFKLTRENPYFTQSESYTLDVTLPTDIIANRQFFQNLQRMERTKRPPVMKCRLLVDNIPVLCGSAKVIQVTEQQVKVQLFGGRSEVNFLSTENKDYIDELPLGTRHILPPPDLAFYSDISTGLPYSSAYVFNETSGDFVDSLCACHPQLTGIMRLMLAYYGFSMQSGFLDEEPWNRLYIVSALHTLDVAHKLPHWTVKEFFEEFCNFFCVTPLIDQEAMTVEFVVNSEFLGRDGMTVSLEPVDEYKADISEDEEAASLMGSTVEFDLSGSSSHDYDCLAEKVRQGVPRKNYVSLAELNSEVALLDAETRRQYMHCAPGVEMISWVRQEDSQYNREWEDMEWADLMKPLDRGTEKKVSLKIVPVAIGHEDVYLKNATQNTHRKYHGVATLESPSPDETPYPWEDGDGNMKMPAVQDFITGEESVTKEEKEDRMQVMFDDAKRFERLRKNAQEYRLGFIDWRYKTCSERKTHGHWSLSLNPTEGAAHYLGELHLNGYTFNMKAKHTFRFIANRMPDPRCIFLIRNKQFACEKIEATVNADGFDKLMTGYFYEML